MNAVDPRFVMPLFEGALAAGIDYMDMANSLAATSIRAVQPAGDQAGGRSSWPAMPSGVLPGGWP